MDKVSASLWIFCVIFFLTWPTTLSLVEGAKSEKNFERSEKLSHSISVSWLTDFQREQLTFKVTARTRGYVGFGLSTNGNMKGSDIVVGGVDDRDGQPYFSDRHALGQTTPILDQKQDWNLLSATQNETHTVLEFSRPFHTCDEEQDISITNDTVNMIWSIGRSDDLTLHVTRGSQQVNFLDPPHPPTEGLNYWTFGVKSSVPTDKDTSYWCTVHKAPRFEKKTHIIGFEVILESEQALQFTHHMILRRCLAPKNDDDNLKNILEPWIGRPGGDCYTREIIELQGLCTANLYVWAKGGHRFIFPDHVGYPVSESGREEYYVMEFHYDNPTLVQNALYDTGIRVFYTTQLRPNDAGFLYVAHEVDSSITLPPNASDWMVVGHCSGECTKQKFPPNGVNFFNVLLHAHLSARGLKLRHFRGENELPWIATDHNYDFNFQQTRPLRQEINVRRGDHLTLECTYDTKWKRPSGGVIGGLSTKQEMCDAFIFYYPRIPELDVCSSSHGQFKRILKKFGINHVSMRDQYNPVVTSPKSFQGLTYVDVLSNRVDWTKDLYKDIQHELRSADHVTFCDNYGSTPIAGDYDDRLDWPKTNYPKIVREYQPLWPTCQGSVNNGLMLSGSFFVLIFGSFLSSFYSI